MADVVEVLVSGGKGTAAEKVEAFRKAGIHVVESPALIGETMEQVLKGSMPKKLAPKGKSARVKTGAKGRPKPPPKKKSSSRKKKKS